jgi:hypothetical protein
MSTPRRPDTHQAGTADAPVVPGSLPAAPTWGSPPRGEAISSAHGALSRRLSFALLCVACMVVAVSYVVWAMLRPEVAAQGKPAPPISMVASGPAASTAFQGQAHVVFQNVIHGETFAKIAFAPLEAADEPRTATPLMCDRVHFAAGQGLCLVPEFGLITRYSAYTFGPDFQPHHKIPLSSVPSRARVSPDGRYGAATVFVFGHSYAEGGFSTQTTLIDLARGTALGDLEQFVVIRNGVRFQSPDFNFWGVTFAREATASTRRSPHVERHTWW